MDSNNQNRNNGKRPSGQSIGVLVLILLLTLGIVTWMNSLVRNSSTEKLGYNEFIQMLENGEVESVTYSGNRLVNTPKADSKNYSRFTQYYTVMIPDDNLADRLLDSGVEIDREENTGSSILSFIVGWVLPSALMIGLLYFMFNRMGGGNGIMGVGKSNAKVYVQKETGRNLCGCGRRGRSQGVFGGDRGTFSIIPRNIRGSARSFRRERFWWVLLERVKPFWRGLWPERRMFLFIRYPVRISWKCL